MGKAKKAQASKQASQTEQRTVAEPSRLPTATPVNATPTVLYRNKSDAIRKQLELNPNAKVVDIIKELARQGIVVHGSHVTIVRNTEKVRGHVGYELKSLNVNDFDVFLVHLSLVKKFVSQIGGADRAIKAIRALQQLSIT